LSVIHTPRETPLDARQLLGPLVMALALFVFLCRLWYLQVVEAESLRLRAEISGEAAVSKIAPRGRILDRNGVLLAGVRARMVVTARPAKALRHPEAVREVALLLGQDPVEFEREIKEQAWLGELPAPVFVGAKIQQAAAIAEQPDRFPGFEVETQPSRYYTEPTALAHIMGYVRGPSDKDVDRLRAAGIVPAEVVGKDGLERHYEAELMGRAGSEKLWVDARRRPVRSMGVDQARPGDTLVLSLDIGLQKHALELLAGRRGAVAALDPRTGEVLCLVSSPTYDASVFLGPVGRAQYAALRDDPANPMFARAMAAAYAPGSTFKIVTTLAAASVGKFSENRTVYCGGAYVMGRQRFRCLGTHGAVGFRRAMAKSCNTYFADLANEVGPEAIRAVCEEIGIGRKTGLDVPGEAKGLLPTQEWWDKNRDRRWSLGDTVHLGVGQGELAVTPLQMACVAMIVANEGRAFVPHLARAFQDPLSGEVRPREPAELGSLDIDSSVWKALKSALVAVVQEGTARRAQVAGLTWGGKTGSAENRKDRETHSWFVGIAPMADPRVVLAVIVENQGHGGDVAAPLAGSLLRWYLKERPAQSRTSSATADSAQATPSESPAEE
jgi:penicillin-binding protein 2